MMLPTIHLNGTAAGDLFEDYTKASTAVYNAILAVQRSAPHARDYYRQSPGAFAVAQSEHEDRLKRLEAVRLEVEQIIEEVMKHLL